MESLYTLLLCLPARAGVDRVRVWRGRSVALCDPTRRSPHGRQRRGGRSSA